LVIDYNPEIIEGLKKEKISCMYGDMSNLEILRRINFKEAKVVISTIARESDNLALLGYIKDIRSNALIIMTAANSEQALTLYEKGADYVLVPAVKTGEIISSLLEKYMDKKKLLQKLKQTHIKNLQSSNKEKS
ncbi:NAD-binding protein, partial [Candidatus Woesearchaeota archaeon]|nr:NAD-binding protein [Candidatus Woesearchaeota archaeon]